MLAVRYRITLYSNDEIMNSSINLKFDYQITYSIYISGLWLFIIYI